jgi:TonB family protein
LPSPLLGKLLQAYVYPWPARIQIARWDAAAEPREIGGLSYTCISMKSRPPSQDAQPEPIATHCFEPGSSFLRIAYYEPNTTLLCNRPVSFQGRLLPGDLELKRAGKLALTAHLESIEPITPVDEAVFTPPPDAVPIGIKLVSEKHAPGDGRIPISAGTAVGLLNTTVAPVYPPIAKAAHVQGTVVLQAVIGKDGQIRELHVISGPAMLQQAAMDAVKAWGYKPYMLNGKPVEVLTTVNVIFTLGDKPQPNQAPPPTTR